MASIFHPYLKQQNPPQTLANKNFKFISIFQNTAGFISKVQFLLETDTLLQCHSLLLSPKKQIRINSNSNLFNNARQPDLVILDLHEHTCVEKSQQNRSEIACPFKGLCARLALDWPGNTDFGRGSTIPRTDKSSSLYLNCLYKQCRGR